MIVLTLAGCGFPGTTPAPAPTPTALPPPQPTPPVVRRTATPSKPKQHPVQVAAGFKTFLRTFCGALSAGNAGEIENELPYYQYNSGVYYGTFDGAGRPNRSADPTGNVAPECPPSMRSVRPPTVNTAPSLLRGGASTEGGVSSSSTDTGACGRSMISPSASPARCATLSGAPLPEPCRTPTASKHPPLRRQ